MDIDIIQIVTVLLGVLAMYQFFFRNDEFLILLLLFFIATGLLRYIAVLSGETNWAIVAYAKDIFDLNDELALVALNYFLLGTATFMITYFLMYVNAPLKYKIDNQSNFNNFLMSKQKLIFILFGIFLVLNGAIKTLLSTFESRAFGAGYLFLFRLILGGLILLFFLIFKNIGTKNTFYRFLYLLIIVFAGYSSYDPELRFQFLSWMIAMVFVVARDTNPLRKFWFYLAGGTVVLFIFAMAGNLRHAAIASKPFGEQVQFAFKRIAIAEDQNMLDGFMMVLQVYPEHLDYSLGMEHLEILMRPIPRAIWPGKPVGGYANKLGLNEGLPDGTTVGISQSIYGSFYGEGGIIGIIVFAVLYAVLFVWLFKYANRYNSDMKYLIKGIVFASAVPLLRGGDLPGIFAFIGMSYVTIFVFLFGYNRYLLKLKKLNTKNE